MKVTCEIKDYSNPAKQSIRIHNAWNYGDRVELEVNGEIYVVSAAELKSAVDKATLNLWGY